MKNTSYCNNHGPYHGATCEICEEFKAERAAKARAASNEVKDRQVTELVESTYYTNRPRKIEVSVRSHAELGRVSSPSPDENKELREVAKELRSLAEMAEPPGREADMIVALHQGKELRDEVKAAHFVAVPRPDTRRWSVISDECRKMFYVTYPHADKAFKDLDEPPAKTPARRDDFGRVHVLSLTHDHIELRIPRGMHIEDAVLEVQDRLEEIKSKSHYVPGKTSSQVDEASPPTMLFLRAGHEHAQAWFGTFMQNNGEIRELCLSRHALHRSANVEGYTGPRALQPGKSYRVHRRFAEDHRLEYFLFEPVADAKTPETSPPQSPFPLRIGLAAPRKPASRAVVGENGPMVFAHSDFSAHGDWTGTFLRVGDKPFFVHMLRSTLRQLSNAPGYVAPEQLVPGKAYKVLCHPAHAGVPSHFLFEAASLNDIFEPPTLPGWVSLGVLSFEGVEAEGDGLVLEMLDCDGSTLKLCSPSPTDKERKTFAALVVGRRYAVTMLECRDSPRRTFRFFSL